MKPGHVATSAVDYLARKKGLVLNSADISNTIIANVDAAEHRGVAVPPGTPEGYVLTVNENNKSGWKISEADVLLTSPNRWTLQQEFKTPPIVSYTYANLTENSNQVVTTQVAHQIVNQKFNTLTLSNILNVNSVGSPGQQIQLTGDSTTAMYSSSQILFTYASGIPEVEKTTSYSNHAIVSPDLYTISSTQGINIEGQVTFDRPPRAPKPEIGNDIATKSYVDTLVGNYSGSGLNLYMNSGQLSPAKHE